MSPSKEPSLGKTAASLGGKLESVQVDQISVSERARKDMGNIEELKLSILDLGQLQNLVVTSMDGAYQLRAGGRRLQAMKELKMPTAHCLVFTQELTDLEILRIELEENTRRANFSWQEEVALKKRVYDLMIAEHGEKTCSMDTAGVSLRDAAKVAGVSPATMSLDHALAKAVEQAPEVFAECKTKTEARKHLTSVGLKLAREELSRRFENRTCEAPGLSLIQNMIDRYRIADFFQAVKEVPDNSVYLVEMDPRIGLACEHDKDSYKEVPEDQYLNFIKQAFQECYRVMSANSWLICWHAWQWGDKIKDTAKQLGFTCAHVPGLWVKPTTGSQNRHATIYLGNAVESFLYLRKGDPHIVREGRNNVFSYMSPSPSVKTHPTERPIELILDILSTFAWEGSSIMVPFLGSGKTLIAAQMLKMSSFGYEISSEYKAGYIVAIQDLYDKGLLK